MATTDKGTTTAAERDRVTTPKPTKAQAEMAADPDAGLKFRIARASIDGTPLDGANGATVLGLTPTNAATAVPNPATAARTSALHEEVSEQLASSGGEDEAVNRGPTNNEIFSVSSGNVNPLDEDTVARGQEAIAARRAATDAATADAAAAAVATAEAQRNPEGSSRSSGSGSES